RRNLGVGRFPQAGSRARLAYLPEMRMPEPPAPTHVPPPKPDDGQVTIALPSSQTGRPRVAPAAAPSDATHVVPAADPEGTVVPLYDLGRMPDRRPFFAMKLVHGRTFAELLRDRPTPASDLPRMLNVFLQVCQTVAYAHSQGVVHRDLKPGNVMVGEFGEVQV